MIFHTLTFIPPRSCPPDFFSEKPAFDKAATKKFDDMIDGDLKDLPPLPKSMVRVFLSSTFSGKIYEELLYTKRYS